MSKAFTIAKQAYNRVLRPHLPRKLGLYNDIPARAPKLLDSTDHIPDYKGALLSSTRESVMPGEDVVVIGGGKGIASVTAAGTTGTAGSVTTFEARPALAEVCRETQRLNGVSEWSDVVLGCVGPVLDDEYGVTTDRHISVRDLPAHDALVMDCEGAEMDILDCLSMLDDDHPARPDRIVVETHAEYDAAPESVRESLSAADYETAEVRTPRWDEASADDRIIVAAATPAVTVDAPAVGPEEVPADD